MRAVDRTLALQVEQAIVAERRAFAAATAGTQDQAAVLPVAGGHAIFTGHGLFSNRVFGLGLTEALSPADLDRIERFYAERSSPTAIEVASVADPALLDLLAARRYRLRRFRNIYAHGLAELVEQPVTAIEIEPVTDRNRAAWSAVLIEGFGYRDQDQIALVEEWNDALLATPGLTAFSALLDGRPVGSASVLISGSAAVLGGAATVPRARRRGVQSALIAARLELARDSRCELAVVTADPGGTSARNAERAGFDLVCTHAVLSAPPDELEHDL